MSTNKEKFTPGPWKVHRKECHKMGIDFTSVSIHSDKKKTKENIAMNDARARARSEGK